MPPYNETPKHYSAEPANPMIRPRRFEHLNDRELWALMDTLMPSLGGCSSGADSAFSKLCVEAVHRRILVLTQAPEVTK